jgi:hypothetical protein
VIKTFHFQTRLEDLLAEGKDKGAAYNPISDRLWHSELWFYEKDCPGLLDDYPAQMPTSTFMKVLSLEDPKALVVVDITGVVSRFDRPGWEVNHYSSYISKRGFPRGIADVIKYYSNTILVGTTDIYLWSTRLGSYDRQNLNRNNLRIKCLSLLITSNMQWNNLEAP